mgnify:CR=1 FL=1
MTDTRMENAMKLAEKCWSKAMAKEPEFVEQPLEPTRPTHPTYDYPKPTVKSYDKLAELLIKLEKAVQAVAGEFLDETNQLK